MQAVLNEIHRITQSQEDVVQEAELSVAYERPLDVYLTECLALATVAMGYENNEDRANLASSIEPTWVEQLRKKQPLLPTGVTGARLGLFVCALGMCPFVLPPRASSLQMDSLPYRITWLGKVYEWFSATSADTRKTIVAAASPPTDTTRGSYRAEMPIEFLIAMIGMLHTTSITPSFRMSMGADKPAWVSNLFQPKPICKDITRFNMSSGDLVYTAPLSSPSSATALMRAVVVVELARQHTKPDTPAHNALPVLIDWDIYPLKEKETALTNYAFSVHTATPRATRFTKDEDELRNRNLDQFMYALYNETGAYPTMVQASSVGKAADGNAVILLDAFVGAQWPTLPQYDKARSTLWRTRFANPTDASKWFAAVPNPAPADEGPYKFDTSGHVALDQMVQARISARLRANPYCRKCAAPLDKMARSVTCPPGLCAK